jgi:hypothetical protein
VTTKLKADQDFIDHTYLQFLYDQCSYFERSTIDFYKCISDIRRKQSASEPFMDLHADLFRQLQSIMGFAGNVSKMLWPDPGSKIAHLSRNRGERLRKLLGISDDPVIKSRKVRNHYEHMDERLDVMWQTCSTVIMNNTFDRATARAAGEALFSNFDTASNTLTVQGDEVELVTLYQKINEIKAAAVKANAAIVVRQPALVLL